MRWILQVNYDKALQERQHLIAENESLRSRLRDVVHSPLSDAEKQQIIDDSQQRLHSSAPASIAMPNVSDCNIEDGFSIWSKEKFRCSIFFMTRAMVTDYLV